jgi:hypothetical protein
VLVLVVALQPPLPATEGALAGAVLYYLLVMALAPVRLRRARQTEARILAAYGEDLGRYLDELEG